MPEKHLLKNLVKLLLLSQVPRVHQLAQRLSFFGKRTEAWVLFEGDVEKNLSLLGPVIADLPL